MDRLLQRFEYECPTCRRSMTMSATGERAVRHCETCAGIHLDHVMVGACLHCEAVVEAGLTWEEDEDDGH